MAETVLITGASSGLGDGMARHFAARGYNLALCARRKEPMDALKAEMEAAHAVKVTVKTLDVRDYDQIPVVFEAFAEEFGHLDKIIINAGMGKGALIGTGYFHAHRETIEVNFTAAVAQCEAAMAIFTRQGGGHLVGISSASAARGLPGKMNVYAATKGGFTMVLEGIRAHCKIKQPSVTVTTLFPGFIDTPINRESPTRPFVVDVVTGTRQMVDLIERKVDNSSVPRWPWSAMWYLTKVVPIKTVGKFVGYK